MASWVACGTRTASQVEPTRALYASRIVRTPEAAGNRSRAKRTISSAQVVVDITGEAFSRIARIAPWKQHRTGGAIISVFVVALVALHTDSGRAAGRAPLHLAHAGGAGGAVGKVEPLEARNAVRVTIAHRTVSNGGSARETCSAPADVVEAGFAEVAGPVIDVYVGLVGCQACPRHHVLPVKAEVAVVDAGQRWKLVRNRVGSVVEDPHPVVSSSHRVFYGVPSVAGSVDGGSRRGVGEGVGSGGLSASRVEEVGRILRVVPPRDQHFDGGSCIRANSQVSKGATLLDLGGKASNFSSGRIGIYMNFIVLD